MLFLPLERMAKGVNWKVVFVSFLSVRVLPAGYGIISKIKGLNLISWPFQSWATDGRTSWSQRVQNGLTQMSKCNQKCLESYSAVITARWHNDIVHLLVLRCWLQMLGCCSGNINVLWDYKHLMWISTDWIWTIPFQLCLGFVLCVLQLVRRS